MFSSPPSVALSVEVQLLLEAGGSKVKNVYLTRPIFAPNRHAPLQRTCGSAR